MQEISAVALKGLNLGSRPDKKKELFGISRLWSVDHNFLVLFQDQIFHQRLNFSLILSLLMSSLFHECVATDHQI
jgi:hypothetical protein